ncbi:MAG: hypothetical protein K0R29_203 [Pseudobdellovibrio sp.]|nr:hypothetical protein [Pseudobdellovibrio sp.]
MKSFLADAKFILILLAIVTAISGVSNMEVEAEQKPSFQRSDRGTGFTIFDNQAAPNRQVASIAPAAVSQVITQNFFCNHSLDTKAAAKSVDSALVMVDFKICKDLKNVEAVHLINQTNGFKAHIFKTDNFSYKTDFIQLNKGSNKITVEVVLKDGQKKQDSLVILTGS